MSHDGTKISHEGHEGHEGIIKKGFVFFVAKTIVTFVADFSEAGVR